MSTVAPSRAHLLSVRDVALYVEVVGRGYPVVLMHGGPGADHYTLYPFRRLKDRFTLVYYDHRCNGRSQGGRVESMTWENLTADADALRERLGFEKWAVLGHSFGGNVALEYALRYPAGLSHLILIDTGADGRWPLQEAAENALARTHDAKKAELVRRWFNGEVDPHRMMPTLVRIGGLYQSHPSLRLVAHELIDGGWRTKTRGEPLVFAGRHLLRGWNLMDRLHEISAPTLVIAGRDDFIYPPESQREMTARLPNARLLIIDGAGHNPFSEQPDQVMAAVRAFLAGPSAEVTNDPFR